MPEHFAGTDRPHVLETWPGNPTPQPECGVWVAVSYIALGALTGFIVGLVAWAIWGTR